MVILELLSGSFRVNFSVSGRSQRARLYWLFQYHPFSGSEMDHHRANIWWGLNGILSYDDTNR